MKPHCYLILACALAFLTSCSRPPRTAEELKERLPLQFTGKFTVQGEGGARHVRVSPQELTVIDTQTLGFDGVHVVMSEPIADNILFDAVVPMRGTITVPDLQIHLTDLGADAQEAINKESFAAQLSQDLKEINASWQTPGQQQEQKLTLDAVK